MSTYIGNMGHWIAWWGKVTKDREAIVFQERRISYSEFNSNINRVAHALREKLEICKGDRVACLMHNKVEFLEVAFACSKIGARFVPINTRLVGREMEYIINNCAPRAIFTEDKLMKVLEEIKDKITVEEIINVSQGQYQELTNDASEQEPEDQASWDDDFAILYTSGTTGLPKGAILTQENVKASTYQKMTAMGYSNHERIVVAQPLCFMGALVPLSMPVFHSGGTIILETDFDAERFLKLIETEKITVINSVPTMYKFMSDLPIFESIDFSSVKYAGAGAAPVPLSIIKVYREKGILFFNGYGLTEGSGANLFLPIEHQEKVGAYTANMWNEVRVVDEHDCPVKPGTVGEITIRGPVVMRGYWNLPEATAQAIRDGWLHTGDMASVDEEGYIYIVDRKKDMIITGGLNVYSAEVENVLYAHPDLSEVAVVGLPHEVWGEAVVAIVSPKKGRTLDEKEVIKYCRENLADYKSPKSVIIVDVLPRNAGGKVLKRILREKYQGLFGPKVDSAS